MKLVVYVGLATCFFFFLHLVDVYSDVLKINKDTVGKKENCWTKMRIGPNE